MCIHAYHLIFKILKPINYAQQKSDYNAQQGWWLPRKKSHRFSFLFFSFLSRLTGRISVAAI
jgi:hypothetical protein